MPSSNLTLASSIVAMVDEVKPVHVLDVGPGHGKYGVLVREYCRSVEKISAVEAEPRYVEQFPWLTHVYDRVWVEDVSTWGLVDFDGFDLVLMVDVLEHLTRDDGARLVAGIEARVIVCTPRDFFQNPEADQGWETERHRSVWTVDELAALRRLEVVDHDALRIGGVLVRTAPLVDERLLTAP